MITITSLVNLLIINIMKDQKYQSVQTIRKVGSLKAIGSLFCNGISNKYDDRPP